MTHPSSRRARYEPADMHVLNVLHVCGSRVSRFHHDLSMVYARAALLLPGMRHHFVVQTVGDRWCLGTSLDSLSPAMSLPDLLHALPPIDLAVPYQFCPPGMSSYRAFLEDVLGVAVVGSPSRVTSVATDKGLTRLVAERAGVPVAAGTVVRDETTDEIVAALERIGLSVDDRLIVKPNREDNSVGVALVADRSALADAVEAARRHDPEVLIEAFVPGREFRAAVIETDDGYYAPALIEYRTNDRNPVRTTNDKLAMSSDGSPAGQAHDPEVEVVCPAVVDDALRDRLNALAIRMHRALDCRDYSLFDFRVDERTGEPVLLEAGLFWTFGRISIISTMVRGAGDEVAPLVDAVWRRAAQRGRRGRADHDDVTRERARRRHVVESA